MHDIRQSKNYANYLSSLGWKVERIKEVNHLIKELPIIGSVLKIQRPEKINFISMIRIIEKYRVFQTIIEPKNQNDALSCMQYGFKLSKNPYLPTKTLHLNLTKPLKFNKETRRCIKIGDRVKIKKVSSLSDLKEFRRAWKKSVKFTRFVPGTEQLINLRKSFPGKYSLFIASHNINAGAIFIRTKDIAYYWQAFTSNEGRTSLSQYSLLYQGILWAKKQGCKIFDFEGIFDPRFPNKSWLGFTHFKHSFGGYEVTYPGCYIKTNWPNIFPHFR